MPLSPDAISLCEDLLNRIATELVLATPGSDDGLVPVYALVNELSGVAEQNEATLTEACCQVRMALDELLDESQPFDQRTLGYLGDFTTWAHDCLLKLRNGEDAQGFPPAAWLQEGDEDFNGIEGPAVLDLDRCDDLINRIATELVIASSGSDEGLVPMYALAHELAETAGDQQPQVVAAVSQLRAALDALLDNARPFDNATLDYVGQFTSWAQSSLQQLRQGASNLDEFPPMEGLEQAVPVAVEEEEPKEPDDAVAGTVAEPEAKAEAEPELLAEVSKASDVLMQLGDEDRELLGEFHTEATEHLENIEAAVLTLEGSPKDADSLALIFRAFHTIKGVAGFLHLVPIQALAHEVETLLDYARNGKLVLNSEMITLILKAKDTLQALVEQIRVALEKGVEPSEIIPVSHLIISVQLAAQQGLDIADGRTPTASNKEAAATQAPAPTKPEPASEEKTDAANEQAPANGSGTVAAAKKPSPAAAAAAADANGVASTIRVRTSKLDNLLDMVGELVIVQSQLSESSRMEQVDDNSPLQRNVAQLQRITRELQNTSMSLRLVPIKPTFQKVGRLVRDLSGNFGKKVNFVTEGEDTELDRNVVEQISDPLVHMIRNSLDHGLESGEERKKVGKQEMGTISLKAYHQGSSVVIELQDDGRGINPEKILKKAREKGLVREDQQPSKADILNLIFEPGFSTAEKVSDISGRGVGMDVVRRNIEKLRGKVELESDLGHGTRFKIKLPLTTAIIDGLVVRVGEDRFILPTTSVKVALRPEKSQISKIKGKAEVLDLRGKTIPLVRLHKRFNIETQILNHWDGIVVIVETFGRPYGLLVDDMVSKQEVVIKNLGSMMKGIPGVAGGAILGDGNIALILDPSGLVGQN